MDELRLNQVCMNLLSNAQKYTHTGGCVWFTCTQLGEKTGDKANFLFSVRDTGMGMSKSFQENLFGAFEREKRAEIGQIQGSGLGLAITKHIVDLMGGRIEVESEQGIHTRGAREIVEQEHEYVARDNEAHQTGNAEIRVQNAETVNAAAKLFQNGSPPWNVLWLIVPYFLPNVINNL